MNTSNPTVSRRARIVVASLASATVAVAATVGIMVHHPSSWLPGPPDRSGTEQRSATQTVPSEGSPSTPQYALTFDSSDNVQLYPDNMLSYRAMSSAVGCANGVNDGTFDGGLYQSFTEFVGRCALPDGDNAETYQFVTLNDEQAWIGQEHACWSETCLVGNEWVVRAPTYGDLDIVSTALQSN